MLRPDLIKLDLLKTYQQSFDFLEPESILIELSSAVFNIRLRNQWMQDLPSWWVQIYITDDNTQKLRIFRMACCMGHVDIARSIYRNETFS
ncbi:hypothetical protein HDU76_005656 [Blyttiomyces sp. JEL0837]|nr:hypothetical protein HDU76_005656 [Blyttiomyces sp. JEL0837]